MLGKDQQVAVSFVCIGEGAVPSPHLPCHWSKWETPPPKLTTLLSKKTKNDPKQICLHVSTDCENSSSPYGTLLSSSLGSQFHGLARTLLYISIFPTSHPAYPLPSKLGSLTSALLHLVVSPTMLLHPQLETQVLH